MYIERHSVVLATDADGACTAYTDIVTGLLSQISYAKTDFADGVDFVVTVEETGETLWSETNVNASAVRAPRQLTYTSTGSSIAYAATFGVYDKIAIAKSRIKIVIAQGGDTKSGTLHFMIQ